VAASIDYQFQFIADKSKKNRIMRFFKVEKASFKDDYE
jgi:hypothetical protein